MRSPTLDADLCVLAAKNWSCVSDGVVFVWVATLDSVCVWVDNVLVRVRLVVCCNARTGPDSRTG